MKKKLILFVNCILLCVILADAILPTQAARTAADIEKDIQEDQGKLDGINDNISDLEDEQAIIEEQLSDLDAELLNTLTEIDLLTDSIATKTADIEATEALYKEAKATEEAQYEAMVSQIQFMYEMGETDYLSTLFEADSYTEMLNQASYIEAVFAYDQKLLDEYEQACNDTKAIWDQLVEDKASLEADKVIMEEQKENLDVLIARKRKESADFDAQLASAKQEAKALKAKIKQEQADLKKLKEEEKRRQEAAKGNYTVSKNYADIINGASGSDLGKKIATYGCQFIGNPYVMGGTSLTKGADCSGFTYRIYKDFGYSIPRTSRQQRSAGKEVSYENAQPGDLICYDGHVGLYMGGGYIVHASSKKTGIKVSKATYRQILSVRRIL